MNRRNFLRNTAFTSGALLLQKQLVADIFQQPSFKITMLHDNIGIFTEKGGTIAFHLGKEGIVVVDAQFPEQSKHLIDELKKKSDKPFQLLINTHHHGDHTAGNISFQGIVGGVLAHTNSLKNQKNVAVAQKTEDKQLYPNQTYTETWSQKFRKEEIAMYYYGAAHTDGDSLVHFKNANIVHMGDLMFNRRHPFIDRSAGASIKSWINVLDKTDATFDKKTQFIFGHAADGYEVTGTKEDLKMFKDYFEKLLAFAESEIKAGKSKEDFIKNTAIPGVTEWKGDGIQRALQPAYEELTA